MFKYTATHLAQICPTEKQKEGEFLVLCFSLESKDSRLYDKKSTVLGPEQEVVYKVDLTAVFDILVPKS